MKNLVSHPARRRGLIAAVSLGLAAGLLALPGCGNHKVPRSQPVPAGATVLALGDSLTFGTGAAPDASYPARLAALTGWQVINAGVPGDQSADALARQPALLAEHKPVLVILSIGGNDFLRGVAQADTRSHIRQTVQQAQASGAQVLLVAVPRLSLTAAATGLLNDHRLYGELAEQLQVPLQRQGWSEVLSDERLRSDPIHANAAGYAQMARSVQGTASAVGLLAR